MVGKTGFGVGSERTCFNGTLLSWPVKGSRTVTMSGGVRGLLILRTKEQDDFKQVQLRWSSFCKAWVGGKKVLRTHVICLPSIAQVLRDHMKKRPKWMTSRFRTWWWLTWVVLSAGPFEGSVSALCTSSGKTTILLVVVSSVVGFFPSHEPLHTKLFEKECA